MVQQATARSCRLLQLLFVCTFSSRSHFDLVLNDTDPVQFSGIYIDNNGPYFE
jgi:hypothetical protein